MSSVRTLRVFLSAKRKRLFPPSHVVLRAPLETSATDCSRFSVPYPTTTRYKGGWGFVPLFTGSSPHSLSLSLSAEAAISRERDRIGRRWPLMEPRRKQQYHEGCRLDDINKTKAGIPYLNFFYIWVVCPHRACKHLLASLAQVIRVLPHASSLF
jgi:hypothetical protein